MRRQVSIRIPAPCQYINSNQRLHRMAQAKLTKAWRQASAAAAHGIPTFAGQVHIIAHIYKPRAGRYDTNNLAPTTKAAVDGLVDAGLLVDDSTEWVIGPDHRHGGKGPAEIILEITELDQGEA
jgi:crossover junction endodeoxyribonuclease RusA